MSMGKLTFSPSGKIKWSVILLTILLQLGGLFYIGWRWHNIQVDGIPYQWQCVPRLAHSSFGTDYINVIFPQDTTTWLDDMKPVPGSTVYVRISRDAKGVMEINGASAEKPPVGEDYMKAAVVAIEADQIQFRVGFDRYHMDPKLSDGIYDIAATDSVIASIRMKKGEGVIEGIFVNGMPLELCSANADAAAVAQHEENKSISQSAKKAVIGEPRMVPPKQETQPSQ